MSKMMSSMRIERLNMLLEVLRSKPYISRGNLISECGYQSERTLESDLRFLKRSFGVKIRYSRSREGYLLLSGGKYILNRGM